MKSTGSRTHLAVCAAEARRIGGELLPVAGWTRGVGNTALTYRAPAGVALAITPFNAPANLLAHKLGASFAAGNTTIVKTPPQAPASSAALVSLLLDAGMPIQAVQVLHGGGDIGAQLCAADEVAVISFTGSADTGAAVARAAGPKRLVLELGGNAATIVCEDADVPAAARICARTGYSNSGQSCISVQRVYVQRDRFEEFAKALADRGKQAAGRRPARRRDRRRINGGRGSRRAGRPLDGRGVRRRRPGPARRNPGSAPACSRPWWQIRPLPHPSWCSEVFGALVAVLPYDTFDEVIETCNASRYGLQAGLFTRDIGRIITAWRELQVGGLVVNGSSNFRLDHVPFGGMKDSGFGRESPRWMIDDYTVVKTLLLRGMSIFGEEGA